MTQFSDHVERSSRSFMLQLQKHAAFDTARSLAEFFERVVRLKGYAGPLAVAGGYVRDTALNRPPKDCDLWLDSGYVDDVTHAEVLAEHLCKTIQHGAHVTRVLKSYGTWAQDIQYVVKIELDPDIETPMAGMLILPHSIDFIVMRREAMMLAGYRPDHIVSTSAYQTFLQAVLARVDLRLNAIGASSVGGDAHKAWDEDALMERLVVQYARLDGDLSRIEARMERIGAPGGKYAGWAKYIEGPKGELSVC